ncbi:winged helix-turn-helix domain-containing protein [Nonomuraea sp. NPDC049480]|uniref:winged helix-turn-helix domain-containing protein n=1 Tax=Nonomuraea sp. NPDC049480 TaxID=3364353 RepID=UPI0037B3D9E9
MWRLLRRHGWSCQVPSRQAAGRDEEAIAVWKADVWPQVKEPPRTWAPASVLRTRQVKG